VQDLGSCEALVPLLILSPVALEHAERSRSEAGRDLSIEPSLSSRLLHLVVGQHIFG
jgi:hypothetical protein